MMFRFIGQYTGKNTSINAGGVIFEGHEPAEVECPELARRLSANVEFEAVDVIEPGEESPAPRKRGRPKKNADPVES